MTKLQILDMDDWKRQVLLEIKPVVVDFRAPWCAPLILQCDDLAKLSEEAKDGAKIFHIDITRFPSLAMAYRLMDLPSLALFHRGELLKTYMGIGRVREMKATLTSYLDSCREKFSANGG